MGAHRTYLGGFFPYDDMATVAALPDLILVTGKDQAALYIGEQFAVAFLMLFLNGRYGLKQSCNLLEALFTGFFGKGGIHVRPLVILALCGILQVFGRGTYGAVMQELKPNLCMFLLIRGSLLKQGCDLHIAVFLRFRGIVRILVAGL